MYAEPWSQPEATTFVQKSQPSTSDADLSIYWTSRFDFGGLTKGPTPEQSPGPLNAVGWPILASIWRDEPEPARHEPEPAFVWNDKPEAVEESPERDCALSTLPSLAFALPSLEHDGGSQPKLVEASQPSPEDVLEASMHARVECVLDLIDDGDDEVPEEEYEVKPVRTAYVNYRNNNNNNDNDDYASDMDSELEALMDDEFYDEDDFPTDERPHYLAMGIQPRFKLVPGPNEWAPPPPSTTSTSSAARTDERCGGRARGAPRHSRRDSGRRAAPPPCAPSAEQAAAFGRFQACHHMPHLPEELEIDDWNFIDRPTVLPAAHPTYRTPPSFLPFPYPVSDLEVYPFLT